MNDKKRYEEFAAKIASEHCIPLPCLFGDLEPILKLAWKQQQLVIDRLRKELQEVKDGQQNLFEGSIWHTPEEEPEKGRAYIRKDRDGKYVICYLNDNFPWDHCADSIYGWYYPEDIIKQEIV